MESTSNKPPLVVIVGETASGKSALALALAQQFTGEIVAADSRTVYKELEISTAMPSAEERAKVPHHLLDFLPPNQLFSAAQFKEKANEQIQAIAGRGHLPFLVGGSGLYIDAVLYDFTFTQTPVDFEKRAVLNKLSIEELQRLIHTAGMPLPENNRNPRHLIRVIERGGLQGSRHTLRPNTLLIGLQIEKEDLKAKITQRVHAMFEAGMLEEVRDVAAQYGWGAPALQSPGFTAVKEFLEGQLSLEATKARFVHEHLQLAKRQRMWFKRNKSIHWICNKEEAVDLITTLMNNQTIAT